MPMLRRPRLRLETIFRDVRYAWRLLVRHPGFAAASILTLAIGLGTMTVAFTAVNAFFIRSPPIEGAGAGLVTVSGTVSGSTPLASALPRALRCQSGCAVVAGAQLEGAGRLAVAVSG